MLPSATMMCHDHDQDDDADRGAEAGGDDGDDGESDDVDDSAVLNVAMEDEVEEDDEELTLRLVFHCSNSKARPLLFFTWENALVSTVRQGRLCIHPSKTCMRVTKISAQEENMRSSWYRSVKGNCAGILRWPIFSELRMAADPNTPKTRCSRKKWRRHCKSHELDGSGAEQSGIGHGLQRHRSA